MPHPQEQPEALPDALRLAELMKATSCDQMLPLDTRQLAFVVAVELKRLHALCADGWVSVEERLPETGVAVLVYEPPRPDDHPGSERIFIDHICPDYEYWYDHSSSYEHFMAVGGAGAVPDCVCTGPSEKAPYTHWRPLPEAPNA